MSFNEQLARNRTLEAAFEANRETERERNAYLDGVAAGALRHDRTSNGWGEGGWRGFTGADAIRLGDAWERGYDRNRPPRASEDVAAGSQPKERP